MALVSLNCPNCGGSLKMEDTMEKGFCMYCGTSFLVKDEIQRVQVEHSGNVNLNLNREKEVENLLIRAEQKIDDLKHQGYMIDDYYKEIIDNYIEKALDIDPRSQTVLDMKKKLLIEYHDSVTEQMEAKEQQKIHMELRRVEEKGKGKKIRIVNTIMIILMLFILILLVYSCVVN